MGAITTRNDKLILDFRYRGKRCRERAGLVDNAQNRKRLAVLLKRIEAEITLGTFEYIKYFPNSKKVSEFSVHERGIRAAQSKSPLFIEFSEIWFAEKKVEWRESHQRTLRCTLEKHLYSRFGHKPVNTIRKADILDFRAKLANQPGRAGNALSAQRINKIMMPLRMIINECADRYEFESPWKNIKPLKIVRAEVQPFSLDEVQLILNNVRPDFRNYYAVRFFTGLRTGEVDGLVWENVDFSRRQILVRQALVLGKIVATKTDGSYRSIHMSQRVYDALRAQEKTSKPFSEYVFCTRTGNPINHRNVSQRVWAPLLRNLSLKHRRCYQTRHTAATLWLAAGESPEWIARQLGHSTTEMLFRVYSRFVPNLTRNDGSAFEKLLDKHFDIPPSNDD